MRPEVGAALRRFLDRDGSVTMERRRFGPLADRVAVVGQGTWQLDARSGARR
jgi:hypothetical protein